jgi:hypothetical protein
MKTHNGRCEIYEDDEYLSQFIKGNLRLQSWLASCVGVDGFAHQLFKLAIWKLQM